MNTHDYFYRDKTGREIGPLSLDTLAKFRLAGVLDNQTLIRASDSTEWKPLQEIIPNLPESSSKTSEAAVQKAPNAATWSIKWAIGVIIVLGIAVALVKKKDRLPTEKPESSRAAQAQPESQKPAKVDGLLQGLRDKLSKTPPVPVRTERGSGYIHQSGSFAIEPHFLGVDYFSEGLARVQFLPDTNNPSKKPIEGFIDITGKLVFELDEKFSEVGRFSEGRAWVVVKEKLTDQEKAIERARLKESFKGMDVNIEDFIRDREKIGYIDTKGKLAIPADYDPIGSGLGENKGSDFHEGLAFVQNGTNRAYVNASGKIAIRLPSLDKADSTSTYLGSDHVSKGAYDFSDGLAVILTTKRETKVGRDGKEYRFINPLHGYVDRSGNIAIPPSFVSARPFADGFAVVFSMGKYDSLDYIDRSGKIAFRLENRAEVKDFSEGLAPVRNVGERFCYINKSGEVAFTTQGIDAFPFFEGLARIETPDGFGFIDKNGKTVIYPRFRWAQDFNNGLAATSEGFVNPDGAVVYSAPDRRNNQTAPQSCQSNLRRIAEAKENWLTMEMLDIGGNFGDKEFVRTNGVPDFADLKLWLRQPYPKCPEGGTYNCGPKGTSPRCSVHGALVR